MTTTRRAGRPPKVEKQPNQQEQTQQERIQEKTNEVAPRKAERYTKEERIAIWNSFTPADRRMLGVDTLEQFLEVDNVTGFGPNSEFTKLHDR